MSQEHGTRFLDLWWPLALAILLGRHVWAGQGDEYLYLRASVNGKPLKLAFDTGTGGLVLLRPAAERLGLAFTNRPPSKALIPGEVAMGETEECELTLEGQTFRTAFRLLDPRSAGAPDDWPMDGLVGWSPVRRNIIEIEACLGIIAWFSESPVGLSSYTSLKLATNSDILELEIPNSGGKVLMVDTGFGGGVQLPPEEWARWKAANPGQPLTLRASYGPATGIVVAEEAWAGELALGPLVITDVPVSQAQCPAPSEGWVATLGLAALKRLYCIIDGKAGVAYLRPRKSPPVPYNHNRLGAAFVPVDMKHHERIAHVVQRSPAFEAGVRDGDILLKVDGRDVTNTALSLSGTKLFGASALGTKVELELRRDGKTIVVTPVLRNILPPQASPAAEAAKD